MIIFFGSAPILLIAIIFFAILFQGARTVIEMLPILFYLFMAKNLLVDVGFGLIKNRNGFFSSFLFLILDIIRTILFFYMVNLEAMDFSGILGIIDFVLVLILGGIPFIIGDFCSLAHGFKKGTIARSSMIFGDISIILLSAGMFFLFYGHEFLI